MIFVISVLSIFGNLPNSFSIILYILQVDNAKYSGYVVFGNFMLNFFQGTNFFSYLFFNKAFNSSFKDIFSRLRRKLQF
jgi:hypothetical protein